MNPLLNTPSPAAAVQNQTTPAATAAKSAGVDKNMFLQLLVAQMRHQDPLHPQDGAQFLAQLAQFQQLEQSINAGQDIAAMRADLDQISGAKTATGDSHV